MRFDRISQIARKELSQFFATALGYLFLGAFLLFTLFIFFWVEAFFARNIADIRPLFEWLPILLIFLSAALTMRMWSEERRSGTLEFLLTLPVSTYELVLGKFFACWGLLAIALSLTLALPITISVVGNLDWGPVLAGYVAAMLLGGAYIAIGLFVSAKTSSQIVSLILASLVGVVFYFIGAPGFAGFFGGSTQEFLTLISSGERFETITRGILDFRDLYFYLSVLVAFLILNVFALEQDKWAADGDKRVHSTWKLGTGLLVANVLLVNVWMHNVTALRVDMTQGNIYSISDASKGYLSRLQEPLLIRGYFSSKTHPLLSPLVPRMKDLLAEYEVHGGGNVRVEIVDPADDPELENEANTKYGIRAIPFQVQDRHQASLVNSYFDVLVSYGDEYEVLGFRDLIEVKAQGEGDLDVALKNPEFDVTRSIKQVLFGFQGGSSVFANISDPVAFVGYLSADEVLPEPLIGLKAQLHTALEAIAVEGGDKFSISLSDPNAGDGQLALDIAENYGFQPMAASLFDNSRFYFYLTLQGADTVVQIPIPDDLSSEALQRSVQEGLKRFASGLLKSVVLAAPAPVPPYLQQQGAPPGNQFNQLQGFLTGDFELKTDDLSSGQVPANTDMLVVVDPSGYTTKQVFAMDQYLMQGGTVFVASGGYAAQPTQAGLVASPRTSGLEDWLKKMGINMQPAMVMDPQNAAFPVPVPRNVGGFTFQDLMMLDYPYFVDVRDDGMHAELPIFAGIQQLTVSWSSPLTLSPGEDVSVTTLLQSSPGSWVSTDTNVMPKFDDQGLSGFVPEGVQQRQILGVLLEGKFGSHFAGQESPLLIPDDVEEDATPETDATQTSEAVELGTVSSVIGKSPESARLILFSSNDFLADQTLQMVGSADGTMYLNTVQMVANLVDWATEDQSLVGIRARGNFNRTLPGMETSEQTTVEWINYILAVLGVVAVMFFFRSRGVQRRALHQLWLSNFTPVKQGTEVSGGEV